jgi:hypothetical protein
MTFPQKVTRPKNVFCCFQYFYIKVNTFQGYSCASSNIDPPYSMCMGSCVRSLKNHLFPAVSSMNRNCFKQCYTTSVSPLSPKPKPKPQLHSTKIQFMLVHLQSNSCVQLAVSAIGEFNFGRSNGSKLILNEEFWDKNKYRSPFLKSSFVEMSFWGSKEWKGHSIWSYFFVFSQNNVDMGKMNEYGRFKKCQFTFMTKCSMTRTW